MLEISLSRRLRRTPSAEGVEAAGVKAYTIYNHMLLPTVFRSVGKIIVTSSRPFTFGMLLASVRLKCVDPMRAAWCSF